MKILHINSYYFSGKFYKNLYERQVDMGIDIDVFVPVCCSVEESKFDFGVYTNISRNFSKLDRMFFYQKHNKILKDIIKKYEISSYNLIHAHTLFSNGYIAYKLNQKYKIPYIIAVRNTDVNVFFKYMFHLRKLGLKIMLNAEKVVFLSESYKNHVILNYIPNKFADEINKKSEVVPNGIDDLFLKEKQRKLSLDNKTTLNLIYVGSVDKNKNIIKTIQACDILIKKGYDVNYKIIGKIVDKKYEKLINNKKYIQYIEYSPKEKVISYLRESDIFIMPSITETFGLVYAEAMSQGLPVIYTKGQGFDKQFDDGIVGYSVNCYDEYDIAKKVESILDNYNNISENCINNITKYDWKQISLKYKEMYEDILQ